MNLPEIQISLDVVVILGVITTIFVFIYKKILVPAYRSTKVYKSVVAILDAAPKIELIHYQLYPNGGNSFFDVVNEIRRDIIIMREKQNIMIHDTDKAVFETDENGRCVFVNRRYLRLIGATEVEMLGNGWLNFVHPDVRDEVWQNWMESIKKEMEFNMTVTLMTVDGECIDVHSTALPIRVGTKLTGYLGFNDVIELKHKTYDKTN